MKTTEMAGIPIRLSLFIILVFGLVPSLVFTFFQYRGLKRKIEAGKADHRAMIERQLQLDVAVDYEIYTVLHGIKVKRLKRSIKSVIDAIFRMVEHEYQFHEPTLPSGQIAERIHDRLEQVRLFDPGGYFFILSKEGRVRVYPPSGVTEGAHWLDLDNSNGKQILDKMVDLAQTAGEGFLEYTWPVPGETGPPGKKTSYIRFFSPLGWIIGTGDYLKAVEAEIQEEIIEAKRQHNTMDGNIEFILDRQGNLLAGKGHGVGSRSMADVKQAISQIDTDTLALSGAFFSLPVSGERGRCWGLPGFTRPGGGLRGKQWTSRGWKPRAEILSSG